MAAEAIRLDLDDSHVLLVTRTDGIVAIELDQGRHGASKRVTVVAYGVTGELAEHYIGHGVTAPHPDPSVPLDYVEYAEHRPGELVLGGYRNAEAWFSWCIACARVEISDSSDPDRST